MNFLLATIMLFISMWWSYFILKILQLNSYDYKKIISQIYKFDYLKNDKNKLVFTKRMARLIIMELILKLIFLIFFSIIIKNFVIFLIISLIFLIINPIFSFLSFVILCPIENKIKSNIIKKAKKKLSHMPCKKIGITGSFGKTSTKNILYDLLSQNYSVLKTPQSYNTPMGICKTVLNDLDETYDYFIIEMGARRRGDIEFLVKMTVIDYAILTPVGMAHIETFQSLKEIEQEKSKIALSIENGFIVINGGSLSNLKIYADCKKNKVLVCKTGAFAYSECVTYNKFGSNFTLVIDDKKVKVQTKLLGKTNVQNIVTASATAYLLGMKLDDIVIGISKIKQIPHRLELVPSDNFIIIDDAYNSNYDGAKSALSVLKKMKGRKVIVTCGMIELGKMQYKLNKAFGEQMAKVCDIVIISGKNNRKAILDGLRGFREDQIYFANTRGEQITILKKILHNGDCILFENDLPDLSF